MFVVSLIMNSDHFPADQLSQTFLALLIAYLLVHLAEALLLARYGNEITVMGFTRKVETATSRTLELVASGVILLSTLVVLINIWGLTSSCKQPAWSAFSLYWCSPPRIIGCAIFSVVFS